MRTINVSTDVFAKIWSLRETGEDTENAILSRVLGCSTSVRPTQPAQEGERTQAPSGGIYDRRHNVHFQEGFEVFRNYLGTDYKARTTNGRWVLLNDQSDYGTLNELSGAIGAKRENAWVNWFFLGPDGDRRAVSDLRDQSRISRRKPHKADLTLDDLDIDLEPSEDEPSGGGQQTQVSGSSDGTWRDDVREALRQLGGRASLYQIYDKVEAIRKAAGRSVPRTLDATVRRTLEDHSSDSENYRGADLFTMPEGRGAGVWALR
jgi:hypothetical protein